MGRSNRLRAGLVGILLALLGVIACPSLAAAAECTNTWTGAVSNEWGLAENWSAEHVPNSSDVACIPKEKTAEVESGMNFVELLQGEGRVTISGGSLAVTGPEQSHIQTLHLEGGALKGAGELLVTEFLHGDGGSMEGAGTTVIGTEASAHVDPIEGGPGLRLADKREIEVKGTLEVGGSGGQMNAIEGSSVAVLNTAEFDVNGPEGGVALDGTSLSNSATVRVKGPEAEIRGNEGAELDNSGLLVVNAEGAGNGLVAGTGTVPKLVNTGTVRKAEGAETTLVGFKTDNEELVESQSGTLAFIAGGNSGQEHLDSWVATEWEGQIAFAQGAFTFGGKAVLSGTILGLEEASLKGHRFNAGEAALWLNEASFEITGAEEESSFEFLGTESGEIDLVSKGVLVAEELFVEEGGFDAGSKSTLTFGYSELEGGSLEVGADSEVDLGNFYQEDGATTIGAGSLVQGGDPYVAHGSFEVGGNSEVDLGRFYQEEGETAIGSDSVVTGKFPFVEQGPFEIGVNSNVDFGGFIVEGGVADLGNGSSVEVGEIYVGTGSLDIGEGVDLNVEEELYLHEGVVELGMGATATLDEVYLEAGILTGAGDVITDEFGLQSAVMSGSGTTWVNKLGGIYGEASEAATVEERLLVTKGFFSLRKGTLLMSNGARLRNEAVFNASSEASAFGPQIRIAPESTSNPRIINKREFNKEEGTGTTTITVPFENNGSVHEASGTLHIVNRLGVSASEKFGIDCPCADPVEAATGAFFESQTDIAVAASGLVST